MRKASLQKNPVNEGAAYTNWFGRLSWRNEQGRQCRLRKPTIWHASDRYLMSIYIDVESSKELFCTKDHSNGFNRNIFGQLIGPHSPSHFARKHLSVLIIETPPLQNINTMIRYVQNGCLRNICANVESSSGLLCNEIRFNSSNRNAFGQLVGPHFPSHFARKHLSVLIIETPPLQNVNTMIRYVPNGCLKNICANAELSNGLLRNEIRFNSSNRNAFGQLIKSYSSGHFAQKSSSIRETYRTIKTPHLHVVSI
jgi:hypothetical protein